MTAVDLDGERQGVAESRTPKACPSCGARYPVDALFCSLDGAPLTRLASMTSPGGDPYLGREILGHIEIRQLVGIGAMGRVYRAFQRGIDRDVAVKILHRELSSSEALVSRFHREAKVASRLAHPNVVHILLVGQLADGATYIVMEYLDGLSLQSALAATGGAMPLTRALHIALQLCEAVGEAHGQNIVHRDLKPENVMLIHRADDPDFAKVLDFGIARLNWGEASTETAAGLIFGTARYISPEGAQGERVGPQGDVYSIATMLYQMVAGRTPFEAEQAMTLLVQQIRDPPPELTTVARAAYVPAPLSAVIMKSLSKDAGQRAPEARAFARALLEAAVASGLSAQDIIGRTTGVGQGQRGERAVQLPSLQKTKQHELEPDVARAIRAAPPSALLEESRRGPTRTAYETPEPEPVSLARYGAAGTQITEPAPPMIASAPPVRLATTAPPTGWTAPPASPIPPSASAAAAMPAVETTKWSPPSGFESRLVSPAQTLEPTVNDPNLRVPLLDVSPATQDPPASSLRERLPSSVAITLAGDLSGHDVAAMGRPTPPPTSSTNAARSLPWTYALTASATVLVLALGWGALHAHRSAPAPGTEPTASEQTVRPTSMPSGPTEGAHDEAAAEASAGAGSTVPPLTGGREAGHAEATGPAMHVVLDASNGRPSVGQPVDFAARLVGAPATLASKLEGPRFRIVGPGSSGATDLPAADDGSGVFRTTFTFLQSGHFDVHFNARSASGSAIHGSRSVVVGNVVSVPPGSLSSEPPAVSAPPLNHPPATAESPATSKRWL